MNDPRNSRVETALGDLLRERTGYEISELDRDATFLELGFDSLFLIQFSQQIKKQFGVKVSFRQLIEKIQTINLLVPHLASQLPESSPVQSVASNAAPVPAAAPAPPALVQQPAPAVQTAVPPVTAPATVNRVPVQSAPVQPVPVQQVPTAQPIQSMPAMPNVSVNCAADAGTIEQIILQHNSLMAQHLAMLSGLSPASVNNGHAVVPPASAQPSQPSQPSQSNNPAPQNPVAGSDFGNCSEPSSCSESPIHNNIAATNGAVSQNVPAAVVDAAKPVSKRERFGPYKPVRKGLNNGLTDRQQAHLDQFMQRFIGKTIKSQELAETHRPHFADPRGVAGYRRIWKSMVYQIAMDHSKGAHLRDIDGNRYVDIAMGFGLNLFGQSPDFVTKALHEQLDRGVEVGPQSPIAGEVAKMLAGFARKQRVTFCNTGSEAVMAALRLARTVTGKSKFVYFNKDYHGNFDQVLCRSTAVGKKRISSPAAPGVPQMFADNSIVLDYGTPEALQAIQDQADDIAAVLIEPVQSANPFLQPREFMHEVRRITKDNNIAMIMDEVITGFRAAPGGAQEWFDVWGDMSTYGKILGGGMPIGALAGTPEYMDALDGGKWQFDDDSEPEADMTFFAGTFVRHPLGIVAAHEVLKKVTAEGPELQRRLTDRTTYLVESLNNFFEREQLPIRVAQFASQFRFMFPPDLEYADMLYFHMLDRGVFTRGWGDNCFLSTAHTDADVEYVLDAIMDACLEIRHGGFFPDAVDEATSVAAYEQKKKAELTQPFPASSASSSADSATLASTPYTALANSSAPQILKINRPAQPYPPVSDAMSTISEIQPEGSRVPIFCMPAADGFTRVYHELSDCLGNDQPMYGLDSPGIYGEPLPDTLEEFCAGMVNDIRETQPEGPYLLLGYCSGGTVALEVAHQLIAQGEEVAMLGKIETYNWYTAPSTNPSLWTNIGYEYQRVAFLLRNFFLLGFADKKKFVGSKWDALKIRTTVWKAYVGSLFSKKKRKPQKQPVDFNALWRKHDELCEEYVPKVYPGKIIHYRPARDYRCHVGEEVQATEGLEIHRMRAFPAGIMVSPFVSELAETVKGIVDRQLGSYELSDWVSSDRSQEKSTVESAD